MPSCGNRLGLPYHTWHGFYPVTFASAQSIAFSGSSASYIEISSPSSALDFDFFINTHTVSVWAKHNAIAGDDHLLIGNSTQSNATIGWSMAVIGGELWFWVAGGGSGNRDFKFSDASMVAALTDGDWHNIVFVQPTPATLNDAYWVIDGVVYAGVNDTRTLDSTTIGGNTYYSGVRPGGGSFMDGKVDEMSIFTPALSLADAQSIYNAGTPGDLSSLSPAAWWRFEGNLNEEGGADSWTNAGGATFSTDVP